MSYYFNRTNLNINRWMRKQLGKTNGIHRMDIIVHKHMHTILCTPKYVVQQSMKMGREEVEAPFDEYKSRHMTLEFNWYHAHCCAEEDLGLQFFLYLLWCKSH